MENLSKTEFMLAPFRGKPLGVGHATLENGLPDGGLVDRDAEQIYLQPAIIAGEDRILGPWRIAIATQLEGLIGQSDTSRIDDDGLVEAAEELLVRVTSCHHGRAAIAQRLGKLRIGRGGSDSFLVRSR
jgi:hypothetical protein